MEDQLITAVEAEEHHRKVHDVTTRRAVEVGRIDGEMNLGTHSRLRLEAVRASGLLDGLYQKRQTQTYAAPRVFARLGVKGVEGAPSGRRVHSLAVVDDPHPECGALLCDVNFHPRCTGFDAVVSEVKDHMGERPVHGLTVPPGRAAVKLGCPLSVVTGDILIEFSGRLPAVAIKRVLAYTRGIMKLIAVGVGLYAVWMTATGVPDAVTAVLGAVLSVAGTVLFRGLIHGEGWIGTSDQIRERTEPVSLRTRLRQLAFLILFVPVFAWKVFTSAVNLAVLAFKPSLDFWPGIVKVKGGLRTLTATTVFSNLITLTPGTLTMDYDPEEDDLYVHWIDVTDYGDVTFDDRVTGGLRYWVKRIFE